MRSTLFYIPHADPWLQIPIMGIGWLFGIWCIAAVAIVGWSWYKHGVNRAVAEYVPLLVVLAVAIVWIGPHVEQVGANGVALGIPIRGYGMMLLLGVVCGISLAAHEARRIGLDPDIILAVTFRMFIFGIIGARLYYVVEYWEQFGGAQVPWRTTLFEILKLTDGGLVVYGALIGGVLAAATYLLWHKLPALAVADTLIVGMALGVAFGRIGCLLNGCCYGAIGTNASWSVTFPPGSPPYLAQLEHGNLIGMQAVRDPATGELIVRAVRQGSLADQQHLRTGDRIVHFLPPRPDELDRMRHGESVPTALATFMLADGRRVVWPFGDLPTRTQPVYPTQILSSINAAILCWLLWSFLPFRHRDGTVFALGLTLYPITRFLLEMIRSDEPSALPIAFKMTQAQTFSVVLLLLVIPLWIYIWRRGRPVRNAEYPTMAG